MKTTYAMVFWWRGLMLVLVMALITVLPARAADRDRVEAFLVVTGFGVALDSIALSAKNAPLMLGMTEGDFGALWQSTADDVFNVDDMRVMALDILEKTLSDDLLTHAAEFYASDLGQRLVEVENAGHMLEDTTEKQTIGRALVDEWRDGNTARLEIVTRLVEAVSNDDVTLAMHEELQVRFLMAASAAGVLEFRLDEGALRALIREDQQDALSQMTQNGISGSAYTYRDFSDEDLDAYATALEHPDMKQVYDLLAAVQFEITADRYEKLAFRMADLVAGEDL